ncbi:MAG: Gfo/Idh/MocA family oxidoreductase [Anaerolineales bacterium]|jgi:predicted dehydrogenase
MSQGILRWGFLGTARINSALVNPLRVSQRNTLVAVASRDMKKAGPYASELGIPRAYGSYTAMLQDQDVDVVYVSLPNSLHAEWTVKAVEAGKHVLCEKPLALTVADVDRIIAASKRAGVVVAEAFMYRYHPQTLKVKALVEEGAVGSLRLVRASFSFRLSQEKDIRLDPKLGGGSLWDVGCYTTSYARFVIGAEPSEVAGWEVLGPTGVDELFVGTMRFPGEVFAQIDCGFRTPYRARVEIIGSEGTLSTLHPYQPDVNGQVSLTRETKKETIIVPGEELYRGEIDGLADSVLSGKPLRVSLQESRGNVAAIEALLRSAREMRPVGLP